jgi:hypothetical protein
VYIPAKDAHRFGDRERAAREPCTEAFAFDERHRVVRQSVGLAGREHGDNVGLLERGRDADLALEPGGRHGRRQLGREQLYDDFTTKAVLVGHEHLGHATTTELALEGITARK